MWSSDDHLTEAMRALMGYQPAPPPIPFAPEWQRREFDRRLEASNAVDATVYLHARVLARDPEALEDFYLLAHVVKDGIVNGFTERYGHMINRRPSNLRRYYVFDRSIRKHVAVVTSADM